MGDLKEIGLYELREEEMKAIEGGFILASIKEMLEAFNWAYQEFKRGIDDGYNNR